MTLLANALPVLTNAVLTVRHAHLPAHSIPLLFIALQAATNVWGYTNRVHAGLVTNGLTTPVPIVGVPVEALANVWGYAGSVGAGDIADGFAHDHAPISDRPLVAVVTLADVVAEAGSVGAVDVVAVAFDLEWKLL